MLTTALSDYRIKASALKSKKTIDFIGVIGGIPYRIAQIGEYSENCICITTVEEDGAFQTVFCGIDQISFCISVSPKVDDKPAREIGYKSIMEMQEISKQIV